MESLNNRWRTSTRSSTAGACVEARYQDNLVNVRDSKNRDGHQLAFTPVAWTEFVAGIKSGEFDLNRD